MVGIKEIAKKAGVSISTVSYALNGSPKVTEATRARIQAIAEELDYVPNMAARTLKRQQTNIIGVYLADYGGSFYGELLDGIKKGLEAQNYEMIVCSGNKSHLFIPERMIDGAIVLDWTFKNKEIEQYADRGHFLVILDRLITHENVRKVLLDNKGGATLAIEKAVARQTQKIFLVSGPKKSYDSQERLNASIKELERFAIDYEIISGDFTEPSGYRAAKEIMEKEPKFPIDIFALNDEMAIGIYKYFKETPYEIGKDIRLIGFDNIDISAFVQPRLATISYSKHRWGMLAAEKIIQLITGEETEDDHIYTSFIDGLSFPEWKD
ncbi:LacI family sugar-binding transcriptional regulator [Enterococcus sp. DIV0840]|uniref:LacI family DNA-binding transcriptional regulator n=1 Tax=Enterococcus TaxID=1350 RepID=UPI001A8C8AF0|nr:MULTISPECIES: LacI family DNA-binding transcriptional regulator [Enterococcus]MBO0435018.1 LacI family DNA-binding transcriptional regulator [Enterococcus sp. DIV0849a]MBO0472614.1 LacI family DNA-binding transcriptional regulator [Enterococcus ureasiticus]